MNHSFNIEVAKNAGVDGAIVIENLYYWLLKNKANKKHYHDGTYWTYNSIKAFEELFPYWSAKQLSRILNNLERDGFIKTGNYNKAAYDRTKWYTLTEKSLVFYKENYSTYKKQLELQCNTDVTNCNKNVT